MALALKSLETVGDILSRGLRGASGEGCEGLPKKIVHIPNSALISGGEAVDKQYYRAGQIFVGPRLQQNREFRVFAILGPHKRSL